MLQYFFLNHIINKKLNLLQLYLPMTIKSIYNLKIHSIIKTFILLFIIKYYLLNFINYQILKKIKLNHLYYKNLHFILIVLNFIINIKILIQKHRKNLIEIDCFMIILLFDLNLRLILFFILNYLFKKYQKIFYFN